MITAQHSKILRYLLNAPEASQEQLGEHLGVAQPRVSQLTNELLANEMILKVSGKPTVYALTQPAIANLDRESLDPRERLALHTHLTVHKRALGETRAQHTVQKTIAPGHFDIYSTIHIALAMDHQLRIIRWSPPFERLLNSVTPSLRKALQAEELKLAACEGSPSWLGTLNPRPFDWKEVRSDPNKSALWSENGIWQLLLADGKVDAYALHIDTPNSQLKYFELYVTAQSSFRGYQAMMMDVTSRVRDCKNEQVAYRNYALMSHELRQPMQALDNLRGLIGATAVNTPSELQLTHGEIANRLGRQIGKMKSVLEAFTSTYSEEPEWCPVITQLQNAKTSIASQHHDVKFNVHLNALLLEHDNTEKYVILANPITLSAIFANLLRNAATHGNSEKGIDIFLELNKDEGSLTVKIRDHGPGLPKNQLILANSILKCGKTKDVHTIDSKSGLELSCYFLNDIGAATKIANVSQKEDSGLLVAMTFPVRTLEDHDEQQS